VIEVVRIKSVIYVLRDDVQSKKGQSRKCSANQHAGDYDSHRYINHRFKVVTCLPDGHRELTENATSQAGQSENSLK
jgi:hypothetical protein